MASGWGNLRGQSWNRCNSWSNCAAVARLLLRACRRVSETETSTGGREEVQTHLDPPREGPAWSQPSSLHSGAPFPMYIWPGRWGCSYAEKQGRVPKGGSPSTPTGLVLLVTLSWCLRTGRPGWRSKLPQLPFPKPRANSESRQ